MPDPFVPSDDALGSIVAGARRCFERYGVHRTRMEDVATEAEVSRATLYRYVSGRSELLELVMIEKTRELGARVKPDVAAGPADLHEAFLDALVTVVQATREDAEFARLAEAIGRVPVTTMLASSDSEVHRIFADWLRPLFDRAREEGRLRSDVPEDELATWVQGVLVLVTPRDDLPTPALRETLRKFLMPVVLT